MTSHLQDDDKLYENWLWRAPLGLAMTGLGALLLSMANTTDGHRTADVRSLVGRFPALCLMLCGLALFGNATRDRAVSDALQYQK